MLISLLIQLLLSNAVTFERNKSILFARIFIKALLLSSFIAYNNMNITPLAKGIAIYGGLFNVTVFTQSFNIFLLLISAVIMTLTAFFPRKIYVEHNFSIFKLVSKKLIYNKYAMSNKTGEQFRIIEYALIGIFILCGGMFLISAADLVSVFLSIELQSYGLYILSTLYRDSESSTASGLTYFLLGGLSSCFILLGSALLYANSGTTNLDNIYVITSLNDIKNTDSELYFYQAYNFQISLVILCVGFLFKVSAAPFHFWAPDVYDGIPTIVTTFVAIVAKISIFAFFLELIIYSDYYYFEFSWQSIFIVSSLLSLIVGSILGLSQFRIKRLFAYSTISHVGFILLALSINTTESIQSYVFYIFQYSLSNLNAFFILITMGYSLYIYIYKDSEYRDNLIDVNNSPIQLISQIRGYFYINPFLAVSFAITLFSFVGIPPIMGFFAKQMILSSALDKGYIFMSFVAIITSVIGAGYYLNLLKDIFFFKPLVKKNTGIENLNLIAYTSKGNEVIKKIDQKNKSDGIIAFKPENIVINSSLSTVISILTLLLSLFIFIPDEWFNVVNVLSLTLFKS